MKLKHPILANLVFATLIATSTNAYADDAALSAMRQAAVDAGDLAKGEKVFKKCKACHKLGDGAKNGVGPKLTGIVGTEIASSEGFKYSKAFLARKEEGLVWTPEALDEYLLKPKDYVKKTKMTFAGLKDQEDRANVIAYLANFSDND